MYVAEVRSFLPKECYSYAAAAPANEEEVHCIRRRRFLSGNRGYIS